MKAKTGFILFLITASILISCKKYPENKLWFKKPNDAIIARWNLEQFTVNGVDSTNYDDVKMYTEKGIDFQEEDMIFTEVYEGDWKLVNKKKFITMNAFTNGPAIAYVLQKNLFRDNQ